jgi:hypothetical protein
MEEITLEDKLMNAAKNRELLASDEYIQAQLNGNWLINLAFQMGPNCNLNCAHCYGDYGPHRKGLPSKELADKVLAEIDESGFLDITLTDGEPIREENRAVLSRFAQASEKYPLGIITNASFAKSMDESKNWFDFLKSNGWNLSRSRNLLLVSSGLMYNVPWKNYGYLSSALRDVFPDIPLERNLFFSYSSSGDIGKSDSALLNRICGTLAFAFRDKGDPKLTLDQENPFFRFVTHVNFGKGFDFTIDVKDYDPQGRGLNKISKKFFPVKPYTVQNMGFSPDSTGAISLASNGDVSFGNSLSCFAAGRNYGNVMKESLRDIKKKIYVDPVYQAFRLGGVRFLYSLAQEKQPNFYIEGRQRCDVCTNIFGNVSLLNSIRENLTTNDVVNCYKNYLDQAGIPKIN